MVVAVQELVPARDREGQEGWRLGSMRVRSRRREMVVVARVAVLEEVSNRLLRVGLPQVAVAEGLAALRVAEEGIRFRLLRRLVRRDGGTFWSPGIR